MLSHAGYLELATAYIVQSVSHLTQKQFIMVKLVKTCMQEGDNILVSFIRRIHNGKYHSECRAEFNFRMEGEALFASPLDRQIDESLRIKYSEAGMIMNSGTEWRMDRIPRARVCQPIRPA